MQKGFCPLASGSKGNAIYFKSGQTQILIDAGLSARALQKRLAEIDVDLADIDAILVSHEHTDHIRGLNVLALKMGIPVLANNETAKGIYAALKECPQFKIFSTGETFEFGDMEIHPFSVQHDTPDPVAFTLRVDSLKVGICTDLGFATTLVKRELQECDYLYLEANHDPSMVHACARPQVYKHRVLGRCGHLSNEACGNLLDEVYHSNLKHVHLAHLSEECNSEEKALSTVKNILKKEIKLSIAPQNTLANHILF